VLSHRPQRASGQCPVLLSKGDERPEGGRSNAILPMFVPTLPGLARCQERKHMMVKAAPEFELSSGMQFAAQPRAFAHLTFCQTLRLGLLDGLGLGEDALPLVALPRPAPPHNDRRH